MLKLVDSFCIAFDNFVSDSDSDSDSEELADERGEIFNCFSSSFFRFFFFFFPVWRLLFLTLTSWHSAIEFLDSSSPVSNLEESSLCVRNFVSGSPSDSTPDSELLSFSSFFFLRFFLLFCFLCFLFFFRGVSLSSLRTISSHRLVSDGSPLSAQVLSTRSIYRSCFTAKFSKQPAGVKVEGRL